MQHSRLSLMSRYLAALMVTTVLGFADVQNVTVNAGYNEPGGDGSLTWGQRRAYSTPYDPMKSFPWGQPFTTSHNGWRMWKWGIYPGAVTASNPESGTINYEFTGGGGGGNRGDYLIFWLQEQKPRPEVYYGYYYYTKEASEYDGEYGTTRYYTEYSEYTYSPVFSTRAEAQAFIDQAGPADAAGWEKLEQVIATYPSIQPWIAVATAQTPNQVGNPGSGMGANWRGSGSFTYDADLFGGSKLIVEKYNLQRTSGDDNRVQYDYYEFAEVLGPDNAPPVVTLSGSNGRAPLNP